jgi:hypothetical protein
MKHSPKLILLDLSNTNLIELAMRKIGKSLNDALSIKSIHFSGNKGITPDLVDYLRLKLSSPTPLSINTIKPLNKAVFEET